MRRIGHEQTVLLRGFLLAFFVVWLISIVPSHGFFLLGNFPSIAYSGIIIVWMLTVQQRITDAKIRKLLVFGTLCLVCLFIFRTCRWNLFAFNEDADNFFRYSYYPVFIVVPLISLHTSVRIGKSEKDSSSPVLTLLWCMAVLLCALSLTNGLHGRLFEISANDGVYVYHYGLLYYAVVIWGLGLTLASFIILLHRCRLAASRNLWYIPFFVGVFFAVLLIVYYAAGGSPSIGKIKLYNVHEVYAALFVGLWECCFQIGLIPTNSGYAELFAGTTLGGVIVDKSGKTVYRARRTLVPEEGAVYPNENVRLRDAEISGGKIYWTENLTEINEIKESLREAIEQISAENTLLSYENEMKEQKARIETQSRLYDEIAFLLKPELSKLRLEFGSAKAGDDAALVRMAVRGAYIKRRANLALIAENDVVMELQELYFAVRESVDYLSLGGGAFDVRHEKSESMAAEIPSDILIRLYELFESILEKIMGEAKALMVNISCENGASIKLMTDAATAPASDISENTDNIKTDIISENGISYIYITYKEEVQG